MPRQEPDRSSLAVQLTPKSFALTASGPVLAFLGGLLWWIFSH